MISHGWQQLEEEEEAAMLYFVENKCHSVSFRCQASCRELCASLKGDSKETEPHCCCHGHSASSVFSCGQLASGTGCRLLNLSG